MTTEVARDRKVRMSRRALWFLLVGLVACLGSGIYSPPIGATLVGLYAAFAGGVAGVLGFFSSANARVHEAQSGGAA